MKKLIIFCLLAVNIAAQAQIDIGVKGGVSFSSFYGRYDRSYDNRSILRGGFQLGAYATYDIVDKVKVYTELSYSFLNDGFKYTDGFGNKMFELYSFHYIQLPVLAQYHINDQWHIGTGAQVNFLLGANGHNRINGDNFESKNVTSVFAPIDIGWVLKGGYNFNEQLQAGLYWYVGLAGLAKDNSAGFKRLHQNYISLYLTYSLYKK